MNNECSKVWANYRRAATFSGFWNGLSTLTDFARLVVSVFDSLTVELQETWVTRVLMIVQAADEVNGLRIYGAHRVVCNQDYTGTDLRCFLNAAITSVTEASAFSHQIVPADEDRFNVRVVTQTSPLIQSALVSAYEFVEGVVPEKHCIRLNSGDEIQQRSFDDLISNLEVMKDSFQLSSRLPTAF